MTSLPSAPDSASPAAAAAATDVAHPQDLPARAAPRYSAPALDKGLDILELLADSRDGETLADIARQLGRSVGEIFRMVVTLERRGYVRADAGDRYGLSARLFEVAHRQWHLRSLVAVAAPFLRELAHRARQSCHLATYQGGRVVVVAQMDSPERWSFGLKPGVLMGLGDTSSGHVLLAFRDEAERTRMLTEHVQVEGELEVDPGELLDILRQVRTQGHAVMASQQIRGVTNIAFPVMGAAGEVIAALNVPYIERIDGQASPSPEEVKTIVAGITRRMSAAMGTPVGYADARP